MLKVGQSVWTVQPIAIGPDKVMKAGTQCSCKTRGKEDGTISVEVEHLKELLDLIPFVDVSPKVPATYEKAAGCGGLSEQPHVLIWLERGSCKKPEKVHNQALQ